MNLRRLTIACTALAALICLTGCSGGNTSGGTPTVKQTEPNRAQAPPTQKAKPTEPIKVTADELTKAYMENQKAAEEKYPSGVVLEVSGVVERTRPIKAAGDACVVVLECHGREKGALSKMPVSCSFGQDANSPNNKVVAQLKEGTQVTIKGTLSSVVPQATSLSDCQFIDPKP